MFQWEQHSQCVGNDDAHPVAVQVDHAIHELAVSHWAGVRVPLHLPAAIAINGTICSRSSHRQGDENSCTGFVVLGWLLLLVVLGRAEHSTQDTADAHAGRPMCSAGAGVMVVGCERQTSIQHCTAQQNTAKHPKCCLTNVIVCALSTPVSDQRCRPVGGGDRHCRRQCC